MVFDSENHASCGEPQDGAFERGGATYREAPGMRQEGNERESIFLELLSVLKAYARAAMGKQSLAHTLQASALVNEVYLKLRSSESVRFNDQKHFLRCAAKMMREILVDHARKKRARKRTQRDDVLSAYWNESEVDILELDEALDQLALEDSVAAQVVELRHILGATVQDTAQALDVATRTVERKWTWARAFLREKLQ